jgi:hypothetical protein
MTPELMSRARRVRLLTCDVDGVLTDGRIYVDDLGHEIEGVPALDGVGMHLLGRAASSSRGSPAARARRSSIARAASTSARDARHRRQARGLDALREKLGIAPQRARTSATTCPTCP